jgi:hypothetical protein
MATVVVSMAQSTGANHLKSSFLLASQDNSAIKLKAASISPNLKLDSVVLKGSQKEVFSYNENGTLRSDVTYKFKNDSFQWALRSQCEFYYDDMGNNTLRMMSSWNSTSLSWSLDSKERISYTRNGRDSIADIYDGIDDSWILSQRWEFVYDKNGNDSLIIQYQKTKYSSEWKAILKTVLVYDESGNITTKIFYNWYLNNWNKEGKTECLYDNNYNYEDLIMPKLNFELQHMITKQIDYLFNGSSWDYYGESSFYYSPSKTSLGINPITTSKLKAIGQDGQLLISGITTGAPLAVYNIQGVALYNQKVSSNTVTIPVPENGIYIVRNGEQNVKVVKR